MQGFDVGQIQPVGIQGLKMIVDDIETNGFDLEEQGMKVTTMLAARKTEYGSDYQDQSPQK